MSALFGKLLEVVGRVLAWLSMIGAAFIAAFEAVTDMIVDLTASIAAAVVDFLGYTTDMSSLGIDLNVINAVIPLKEGWAMLVAMLALWAIILAVRWIKSFIPTMAG